MRTARTILLSLLLIFVLKSSADAQTRYYGGIDLGSKGAKADLFSFKKGSPSLYAEIINTKLVSSMKDGLFTDEGIQDATDAVKQLMDGMHAAANKHKLQKVDYFVLGSSGVAKAKNKEALVASVKAATGIEMDFIDAKREGFYGLSTTVPKSRLPVSLYIDIGSGNTKLGCLVGGSDIKNFRSGEIAYGSVTGRKKGAETNPTDIKLGIENLMRDEVAPAYEKMSMDTPCLQNRERIYWTGGAAWATATFTHPERALDPVVTITRADIEKFLGKLADKSWNQKHFQFSFPKDTPPETQKNIRDQAEKDRGDVLNVFVREDLISGVSIMKAVLDSSNPSAAIRFVRTGGNFLTGYVLEKYTDERLAEEASEKKPSPSGQQAGKPK